MKDTGQRPVAIVGGSAEARLLAALLPGAVVRLPAPDRVPQDWACPVSVGPVDAAWLRGVGAVAVLIAPHPCDDGAAFQAVRAARGAGLDYALVRRPPWRAARGDRWHSLRAATEARAVIPPGARVFVTLGRAGLGDLHGLRARAFVRRIGAPGGACPLRGGRFVPGQGPFTVRQEAGLLRTLRIGWLITRNAGGPGGWPKLAAARQLGLKVAMIDRPRWPEGPLFDTAKGAIAWVTARISAG
ncbi:precorrin-6A/cobalt-precorrin-6A reductase [Aestuariicoccus sp. MJ-SS9]|nr:precorrin-6A/cobalt-precorrin-6A reductase [Aestuariicoccus sp. MJ-SS9]